MLVRFLFILATLEAAGASTHTLENGRVRMRVDSRWQENVTGTRDHRRMFELRGQGQPQIHAVLWLQVMRGQSVESRVAGIRSRVRPLKRLPAHDSRDACVLSYDEGTGTWLAIDRIARRADITVHARLAWRTDILPTGVSKDWLVEQANTLVADIEVDGRSVGAVARLVEAPTTGKDLDLVEARK